MVFFSIKSQVTVEFITLIAIASLVAIVFILISMDQVEDLRATKEYLTLKDVALRVKNEVGIASYLNDGYSREFALPEKIVNKDYNIYLGNNTITIMTDSRSYVTGILNVTGNINQGLNTITKSGSRISIN